MSSWINRTLLVWAICVASPFVLAACSCGDKSPSGTPCQDDSECASGTCTSGMCVPSTVDCDASGTCFEQNVACVDNDGDGFGAGCRKGVDCNDNDATQGNREICSPADNADNDCDGKVDEEASPACGCDPTCKSGQVGPGTGQSFDVTKPGSDGAELDPNGNLQLKTTETRQPYIWIVNTGEGTVSKFDTTQTNADGTFKELARYLTGPKTGRSTGPSLGGSTTANDPSRTTVNTEGDVYIGNRNQKSVTKFSHLGTDCPDTNADGKITTSTGDKNGNGKIEVSTLTDPDPAKREVLPWGQDDCMVWSTANETDAANKVDSASIIRAMAAQDDYTVEGAIRPYVWVGAWGLNDDVTKARIYKLDGRDKLPAGAKRVILETEAPVLPYGFALDGNGQLWIASRSNTKALGRIDTTICKDATSCGLGQVRYQCTACANGACTGCVVKAPASCSGATCQVACGDDGTTCAKQRIAAPDGKSLYGITVDKKQRVWAAGDGIFQYVSTAAAGSRWNKLYPGRSTYGIAADGLGFVYAGATSGGLYVVEADNYPAAGSYALLPGTFVTSGSGSSCYGVAVDANGKVWTIHKGDSDSDGSDDEYATVVEPQVSSPPPANPNFGNVNFKIHALTSAAADQRKSAINLDFPYTYSDMTGVQLRLATARLGTYKQVFEGCMTEVGTPEWQALHWDADVPAGTHLTWYVRTGNTAEELAAAAFVKLTPNAPPLASPAPLDTVLGDKQQGQFLEIKVDLVVDSSGSAVVTPVIRNFEATYTCKAGVI